jgi:hypothetical protein
VIKSFFTKNKIPFTILFIVSVLAIIAGVFGVIGSIADAEASWVIIVALVLCIATLCLSILFLRRTDAPNKTARVGAFLFSGALVAAPLISIILQLLFSGSIHNEGIGTAIMVSFLLVIGILMCVGVAILAFIMIILGYVHKETVTISAVDPLVTSIPIPRPPVVRDPSTPDTTHQTLTSLVVLIIIFCIICVVAVIFAR